MKLHPLCEAFPPLSDAELTNLAADIKANGLHHPILTFKGKILDGRNRYIACQSVGVTPETIEITGSEADAAKRVFAENVLRRHLQKGQAAAIVVSSEELVKLAKRAAQERKAAGQKSGGRGKKKTSPQNCGKEAAKDLADFAGCSTRTIEAALAIKDADLGALEKVVSGEVALNRAERIIRDKNAAGKRAKQAEEDALLRGIPLPAPDIRQGAFSAVLADVADVDLVLTDPPYPKEYLPLWSELGAWCARVLRPGHMLVTYTGHLFLPEVIARLSEHLEYVWCGWLRTPGQNYRSHVRPVMSQGRPILFFSRGTVAKEPRFTDEYTSEESKTGDQHEWQQSIGTPQKLIETLTRPGDLIADPFLGAGTFALAAKVTGRRVIGAEIDAEHFATCKERIA